MALTEDLGACLRESAFENRYYLHPRRLAGLAAELGRLFLTFFGEPPPTGPSDFGRRLAHEGLGEKTVLRLVSVFQRHCRGRLAVETHAAEGELERADDWAAALLEGFMKAREAQLLNDQEQLRRALSTALESQSRELLVKNHAIDTSINGILLAGLDGKITWVNASFLALWGFASAGEVVGTNMDTLWATEEARRVLDLLPRVGGWRGELDARRRDGSTFSVELSASLIRNEQGGAVGVMTFFVDNTERKRLQTQILQAQKMDALGQLAGGIAHDFNNLLTAISGYLQLLLLDAPSDTQMNHDLMEIKAATERGIGLTRQLRFFTRQASGNRQILSMNEVIRETWSIFKRTFPPEIRIALELAPSLWTVEADPNQMSQVLVNLCVNARDAMTDPAGGAGEGTLTIETSNVEMGEPRMGRYMTVQAGSYVAVRVRDTGTGMSPGMLERLFVPFVTTKSARSGTGLGLAVVYGIVSSHRGFIDVQSAAGKGSTFEVFFPRAAREPADRAADSSPSPLARGHGRILVVDDEPQVREIVSRVLIACGYEVVEAADGREALVVFADGRGLDLVILDMMMPNMGGRECLSRLRQVQPDVRVIVTTGYTSDSSAKDLLHQGALALMEKPLDLQVLADTVQKSLSGASRGEHAGEGGTR